ncbi:hypothetical protein PILCRDRAFT_489533 [Piloderma croceum F 1598]|uniref:Uncharacterized protein n=1 Tax=Piloderma croceum (strain F 1598) TaxID=765440 RepID=A0A0C3FPY3_PILCF|nr:hypothetical protein PILCRDRAFT_489533 [Piloderma croceum F 1598]
MGLLLTMATNVSSNVAAIHLGSSRLLMITNTNKQSPSALVTAACVPRFFFVSTINALSWILDAISPYQSLSGQHFPSN